MAPNQSLSKQHLFVRFVVTNQGAKPLLLELPNSAGISIIDASGYRVPYRSLEDPENCRAVPRLHGTGGADIDIRGDVDNRSSAAFDPQNRFLRPRDSFTYAIDYRCRFDIRRPGNYRLSASLQLTTRIDPPPGDTNDYDARELPYQSVDATTPFRVTP